MVTYIIAVSSSIAFVTCSKPKQDTCTLSIAFITFSEQSRAGWFIILYLHFNMWPSCNHQSRSICWCEMYIRLSQFLFYSVLCWMPLSPPCSLIWLMLLLLQSRQDSMRETATSGVSGCWRSECTSHTLVATVDSVQRFIETASKKIKALLLHYPGLITTLVSKNYLNIKLFFLSLSFSILLFICCSLPPSLSPSLLLSLSPSIPLSLQSGPLGLWEGTCGVAKW